MVFENEKENISIYEYYVAARTLNKLKLLKFGLTITLPTLETIFVKLEHTIPINVSPEFQYKKFRYISKVTGGGFSAVGCGESHHHAIAMVKSVSESLERLVFDNLRGTKYGSKTSNGWACHNSKKKSNSNALLELVERDAALQHCLTKTPFMLIDIKTAPENYRNLFQQIKNQVSAENLYLLASTEGPLTTLTCVLENNGHGIFSHSSALSFDRLLDKCLIEAFRLKEISVSAKFQDRSLMFREDKNIFFDFSPSDHIEYYAKHEKIPSWIFGNTISWNCAISRFNSTKENFADIYNSSEFENYKIGTFIVSKAKNSFFHNLFFGHTENNFKPEILNTERIYSKTDHINTQPHFIA